MNKNFVIGTIVGIIVGFFVVDWFNLNYLNTNA